MKKTSFLEKGADHRQLFCFAVSEIIGLKDDTIKCSCAVANRSRHANLVANEPSSYFGMQIGN